MSLKKQKYYPSANMSTDIFEKGSFLNSGGHAIKCLIECNLISNRILSFGFSEDIDPDTRDTILSSCHRK